MFTMKIKCNQCKTFALIHVFILQTFPLLVTFNVFEIRKNLDLRKILVTPKIFLKSRFHCTGHCLLQLANKVLNAPKIP